MSVTLDSVAPFLTESRLAHVQRVVTMTERLCLHYGQPLDDALQAALLHDVLKSQSPDSLREKGIAISSDLQQLYLDYPAVFHALAAPFVLPFFFPSLSNSVLEAVGLHTTGDADMSLLSMLIYIADFIEEGRKGPVFDYVRPLAFLNLNRSIACASFSTLRYLRMKNLKVHPLSELCFSFYESFLKDEDRVCLHAF